jgi:plasmid stability protein
MGVTVQVRDLDADVQQALRAAAAREGMSLSAFLRRELTRLAELLEMRSRADALHSRNRLGVSDDFFSGISTEQIVDMVREDRDR